MKPIVAGYVVHGELKNVVESDARALDVINIAFSTVKDGAVHFPAEKVADLRALPQIRAWNPSIKIILSIGGWGAGGFSDAAKTAEGRQKFAESAAQIMRENALDGIDVDWEYPCINWAGIDAAPEDKQNFTLLLRACRTAVGADKYLTIAVANDAYFIANTEMNLVAPLLDYVALMTYDMRGCGDKTTGHHANLFPREGDTDRLAHRSVQNSVRIYSEAGVPRDKLVIGAAFYSRKWTGVKSGGETSALLPGLGVRAAESGYGPGYGEIAELLTGKDGFARYFDPSARAPYLFNGDTFISYDDEQSIAEKCDYVAREGLRGIMYWEHSCDPTKKLISAFRH